MKSKIKNMENKKRIYRNWQVGDKCWFGKTEGWVNRIVNDTTEFPIRVVFDNPLQETSFTENNSYSKSINDQILSYVEGEIGTMPFDYEPELKVDDLVYVKSADGVWGMAFFSHYLEDVEGVFVFKNQLKSIHTRMASFYSEYSITNPLI